MKNKKIIIITLLIISILLPSQVFADSDIKLIETYYNESIYDMGQSAVLVDGELFIPIYHFLKDYNFEEDEDYIFISNDNIFLKIKNDLSEAFLTKEHVENVKLNEYHKFKYLSGHKEKYKNIYINEFALHIFDFMTIRDTHFVEILERNDENILKYEEYHLKKFINEQFEDIAGIYYSTKHKIDIKFTPYYDVKVMFVPDEDGVFSENGRITRENIKEDSVNFSFSLFRNDIEKKVDFEFDAYKGKKENTRSYDWYYTQNSTGAYSSVNCGPAVLSMALKWYSEDLDKPVKEIREEMGHRGLTYTNQIKEYLESKNIESAYRYLDDKDFKDYKRIIDNGNIMILLGDLGVLMNNSSYYNNGHFIIAYGYEVEDKDDIHLLIYDPMSKKENKFDFERINKAVQRRWQYTIEVFQEVVDDR